MSETSTNKRDEQILDASSLIDLKAELFKKREAFRGVKQNAVSHVRKAFKYKGESSKNIAPKEIEVEKDEDAIALQKSRLALEMKSKLYDKLSETQCDSGEDVENYLVDFHRKALYADVKAKPSNIVSDDDGRTSISQNIYAPYNAVPVDHVQLSIPAATPQVDKDSIHYQDIQFNEIRDHGVGYFGFSQDEAKRKEEMDSLNAMHNQTKKDLLSHSKTVEKKKAALAARLAKVCQRRNIDTSVITNYTKQKDTEEPSSCFDEAELNSIPLPKPEVVKEKVEQPIRPWDMDKLDFPNFKRRKTQVGQREWVEDRRDDRNEEFAPPQFYS